MIVSMESIYEKSEARHLVYIKMRYTTKPPKALPGIIKKVGLPISTVFFQLTRKIVNNNARRALTVCIQSEHSIFSPFRLVNQTCTVAKPMRTKPIKNFTRFPSSTDKLVSARIRRTLTVRSGRVAPRITPLHTRVSKIESKS